MDDADLAQAHIERHLAAALSRPRTTNTLVPMGACHYCSEPVDGLRIFCDSDCGEDYTKEKRLRAQNISYEDALWND